MAHSQEERPDVQPELLAVHNMLHVLTEAAETAMAASSAQVKGAVVMAGVGFDVLGRGVPLSKVEMKVLTLVAGFVEAVRIMRPEMDADYERMLAERAGVDLSDDSLSATLDDIERFANGGE